jgi:hypothetical protein
MAAVPSFSAVAVSRNGNEAFYVTWPESFLRMEDNAMHTPVCVMIRHRGRACCELMAREDDYKIIPILDAGSELRAERYILCGI